MVLSDGDRIRNLLGQYCERIDRGDFAGVGALFENGRLADEHGEVLARGAEAVERFYQRTTRLHADGTPRTKHLVVNTVLDDAGENETVVARSSYVVLQATDDLALQPIIAGAYVDRFAADGAGGWRFAERRFHVDLLGELSQHLAIDLR